MNKQEIIKQYNKEEDKFLIAKILDKIQFTNTRNQVQATDFLDGYEQKIAQNVLKQTGYKNSITYGGYDEAERKMIFFFPDKLFDLWNVPAKENSMISDYIKVISIILPSDLKGQYNHRDYLGGLMKLGIKREKIGDILVTENGANILVQSDMVEFLTNNLPQLTRFKKANFMQKSINNLTVVPIKKEPISILVPQLRLDTIIAELLHTSRTKANEIILQERALVNYEVKTKNSTILKQGDLLTIRGKGKFEIGETIGQTAKGKTRAIIYFWGRVPKVKKHRFGTGH